MITKKRKGSLEDYQRGDVYDKEFIFEVISSVSTPSYQDSFGRPKYNSSTERIEAFDVIREKKDGKTVQKVIRLCPGESSIYKDDQSSDKDIPKKKVFLEFPKGKKVVDGEDVLTLKFMMKHNLNESNPDRFGDTAPMYRLVDNAKKVEADMEADKYLDEARFFAWKGEWDEVEAYARVLNVNMNQKAEEIRHDLRGIATRNPKVFLDGLKDPSMRRKHYVLKAIDEGFLIHNPQNNSIAWMSNPNQHLDVAPLGKDVIDSFVRKLSTEEGKLHYDAILEMVSPAPSITVSKVAPPTKEEIEAMKANASPVAGISIAEETDEQLLEMVEEAIKKSFVTFKPPFWYSFRNKSYRSKDGLVTALKGDVELLKLFKVEIMRSRDII